MKKYSQTGANDHLPTKTTLLGSRFEFVLNKWPLNNDHLSTIFWGPEDGRCKQVWLYSQIVSTAILIDEHAEFWKPSIQKLEIQEQVGIKVLKVIIFPCLKIDSNPLKNICAKITTSMKRRQNVFSLLLVRTLMSKKKVLWSTTITITSCHFPEVGEYLQLKVKAGNSGERIIKWDSGTEFKLFPFALVRNCSEVLEYFEVLWRKIETTNRRNSKAGLLLLMM